MSRTSRPSVIFAGAAIFLAVACAADAKTYVLPHVLDSSGSIHDTPFTFDTTMFATYVPTVPNGPTGAAVDLFLFDDVAGTPMVGGNGVPVCAPCTANLDAATTEATFDVDGLISAAGGFDRGVKLGFGVLVVGGQDPDGVNLQGFVVNAHTSPFDLSVFGFEPVPISTAISTGKRTVRLDSLEETPGATAQFGGCTDTLFKAVYAGGLVGGQLPTGASVELRLFDSNGAPLRGADGEIPPFEFELNAGRRTLSVTADELIEAAGGFTIGKVGGYAVATIIGDWENVAMGGYVIETNTGPNDLARFDQVATSVVPEPNSAVLCVVGISAAFGIRRWRRKRCEAVSWRQP